VPIDFLFWNEVVIPLAGMATGLIITVTLIRVVARHYERRHEAAFRGAAGGSADDVRAELRTLRGQVESLEERMDFAERVLTQERARRPLEPGT
jgi:hypothetical protein